MVPIYHKTRSISSCAADLIAPIPLSSNELNYHLSRCESISIIPDGEGTCFLPVAEEKFILGNRDYLMI